MVLRNDKARKSGPIYRRRSRSSILGQAPTLEAWLAWQESYHPKEIDLGLERVRQVAGRLELLQPKATVVTVAGTNGKGSCVATLEKLLMANGQAVGAYTSPHLLRYNERIRLKGDAASDADICHAFAAIDKARGDISLSYFEFGTLAALWLFRHYQLDYWLLEVGLGGRLDATNIMDADIAVVTSIAIDHQQFLGSDRESIGREKAGIFRAGRPVVCADRQPPQSVLSHAQKLECPTFYAGHEFDWQISGSALALTMGTQTRHLPLPQLPVSSMAAALQVAMLLQQLPEAPVVREVCQNLGLPGRFQKITCAGKNVYLDVAHNPAAAEYLAEQLKARNTRNMGVLVAMMADKDIEACLRPLLPYARHWWVAGLPDMPRAAQPQVLADTLKSLGISAPQITLEQSVDDAFQKILSNGLEQYHSDALLVTGSFYTVSAVLQKTLKECQL